MGGKGHLFRIKIILYNILDDLVCVYYICVSPTARSGYRIHVDPDGNATRAIYYTEKELASLNPSRPANYKRCE